jgi:alcohol dehydrogenase class IV
MRKMISPFQFTTIPPVTFGPGKLSELPGLYRSYGKKPAFVLGSSSLTENSTWENVLDRIVDALSPKEPPIIHISSEPTPALIDDAVSLLGEDSVDMVIAVGGGSVLDAGKAISAMLMEQDPVTLFLEGVGTKQPTGRKLPFIAIPTTAGTGSETTNNAVIRSPGKNGFKKSLRHSNYFPDLALVDPETTLSCPPHLTAACGMDCFTQLVEAYLSTRASNMTDCLTLDGIRAVAGSIETAFLNGTSLQARSNLAYATLLSGIVLTNAGLGSVHGLAGTIGGFFDIPHGTVCGSLMAAVNRTTLQALRKSGDKSDIEKTALRKYSKLGRMFSDKTEKNDTWYQDFFIDELTRLTDLFGLPTFDNYGMSPMDFEKIVSTSDNKYNPAQLTREDHMQILSSRLQ